ncbi:DUF4330 family protein [Salarchaeum sp. JOR-1]|uniref:DUF4330 family protein n=1 Tax=Salarchaeum sp. JOR-1 TaxID=2599399 RepID=UPI001198B95B|nr:DUF4330 family protein [Salarchaeum sp. JOR-1]QDX40818.1 DUF4330 domain-containing protein [Salarchaeum sp. JOR-1]
MPVIDDDGRLFGVINVIDALVVLLVIAVLAAGVALINPFANPQEESRYATVDLGTQPDYVAAQISSGDKLAPNTPGNLTVTDVYYSPTQDGDVRVIARVLLRGTLTQDPQRFQYAGRTLGAGNELTIQTPNYTVSGTITRLNQTGATLQTRDATVQLRTTVSADIADSISTGDTVVAAGRQVATVTAVTITPTSNPAQHHVTVRATMQVYAGDTQPQFANQSITLGANVPLTTTEYSVTGQVTQLGTTGLNLTTTDVVMETTVATTTAQALSAGDTYRIHNTTVAEVTSIQVYPTGNPTQKRALIGLSLRTVIQDGTPTFAGAPVKLGTTIPLRTPAYDISGSIVRVRSQTPPGTVTNTTVRIQIEGIAPTIADGLHVGMTETQDGTTYARLTAMHTEPAIVILRSESGQIYKRAHPVKQDVYLTATLRTRQTDTGLTFHARSLQEGTQIVLDLGSITIRGTVTNIQ